MGRELQKKKNRSSLPKVRQKPKSKKVVVQGNSIIASKWNRAETLTQNYRRLGLAARLNGVTRGTEAAKQKQAVDASSFRRTTSVVEEVPVERDERGAIVRVIRSGDEEERKRKRNPLGDPLNDLEDEYEEGEMQTRRRRKEVTMDRGVIPELERLAERPSAPVVRKQSLREEEWIRALVERYGDDYRMMFWDRRLNPMQQSEGDIKRRVLRWKRGREGAG